MINETKIHEGGHFKKYITKAPWYLISSVSTKLIGFILLPVYTSYFSKEEIGSLSVYESLGRIIVVVISLYLDAAFTRYYYKVKSESPTRMACFFSTHFWFVLLWGGGACITMGLFIQPGVFSLPKASDLVIPALLFSQLFSQLVVMLTSLWSANLYVKRLAIFNILFSLLTLLITMYFIVVSKQSWEFRFYALFLISLIQFVLVFLIVIKSKLLILSFDIEIIKTSLKFSIPLIPNIIAGWVAMFSDRIILSYYGHLDQVGVYSIAAQLTLVLYIVNDAITRIQGPLAMSGMTEDIERAKQKMSDFVHIYLTILIFMYFIISIFTPFFVNIAFGDEYKAVSDIFYILGWVYIFSGIYRVFTNVISYHNTTLYISTGAVLQAIINVFSNLVLIPYYGMYAAALSTLLSMMVYTIWLCYFSQKLSPINIAYKQLALIVLVGIFSVILLRYLDNSDTITYVTYILKAVLAIFVALVLFLLQKNESKVQIIQITRRIWNERVQSR
ncbi:polysaccharide biosynthesis C-terminal domain-containing protein [Vibrio sp. St2]|uniref:oligosaccharide flippase family protein n=1 Tax=Vibrio sp. St2 TaxID=2853441 RepID=UPI00248EED93|nr:polysaccharide biosynthesis C-terminal domain-containing protein [Vibrio sp. St2]